MMARTTTHKATPNNRVSTQSIAGWIGVLAALAIVSLIFIVIGIGLL